MSLRTSTDDTGKRRAIARRFSHFRDILPVSVGRTCHPVRLSPPSIPSFVPHKDFPDHHDAELVLKLYELRREPVMRESRAQIISRFLPSSFDDVLAITKSDHPLNAAFRQCSTYWEMTYAMAKHGVIHADFMLESNGEGLLLYSRIEPWLEEYRAQVNANGFRNAEWVATNSEMGRATAERFRTRMQAHLAATASKADA